MDNNAVNKLIKQLQQIQTDFYSTFGVTDIITNSKIFEILIADSFNHILIPGHSGSRDAKDELGNEFEYKHFKETSSNHSWTFNDFTDTTIEKLKKTKSVIFAHIDDENKDFPDFDWYYDVPGTVISKYLTMATDKIQNNRKMINVSPRQIEQNLGIKRQQVDNSYKGQYSEWIKKIIDVILKIEKAVGTKGILTSNKFWEVLVALKLNHKVQSEQAKHDAEDEKGNCYEYKVAKGTSWSFQDISEEVLNKYLSDKSMILATVDKNNFEVKNIYEADTKKVIKLLRIKLKEKENRYTQKGKMIRRKQASLSKRDLKLIDAKIIL